jgi:hypothetical protein
MTLILGYKIDLGILESEFQRGVFFFIMLRASERSPISVKCRIRVVFRAQNEILHLIELPLDSNSFLRLMFCTPLLIYNLL